MKKYFVVTDVHSFYSCMIEALEDKGFDINNPDHIFISCGDLLDRGPDPLECLKFVNSLPKQRKILIRGNHEDLLEECIARKEFQSHDYHNGTAMTVVDLSDFLLGTTKDAEDMFLKADKNPEYKKYKSSLVDYAEVGDYIFVHGWIPCKKNDPNPYHARNIKYTFDENWKNGDWNTACWINGMDAWHQGIKIDGKTIVCGHWHCSYGNSKLHKDGPEFSNHTNPNLECGEANFNPFIDDGIIALDACTVLTHKVNCVVLDIEE